MTKDQEKIQALASEIAKQLSDSGKLVAAGYVIFEDLFGIRSASQEQRNDMRIAYFAGAQHLWGTVMNILEPGAEPTSNDMRRMDNIDREMCAFVEFMKGETRRRQN